MLYSGAVLRGCGGGQAGSRRVICQNDNRLHCQQRRKLFVRIAAIRQSGGALLGCHVPDSKINASIFNPVCLYVGVCGCVFKNGDFLAAIQAINVNSTYAVLYCQFPMNDTVTVSRFIWICKPARVRHRAVPPSFTLGGSPVAKVRSFRATLCYGRSLFSTHCHFTGTVVLCSDQLSRGPRSDARIWPRANLRLAGRPFLSLRNYRERRARR